MHLYYTSTMEGNPVITFEWKRTDIDKTISEVTETIKKIEELPIKARVARKTDEEKYLITLMKKDKFKKLFKSVGNDSEEILGQVVVVIDELFVRSMPSTEGNTPKEFAKMDVVYNVYDIYTDDQYTWYRIGEDQWIADYNGEWVNWVEVD